MTKVLTLSSFLSVSFYCCDVIINFRILNLKKILQFLLMLRSFSRSSLSYDCILMMLVVVVVRGGVEDTRLEAKAKAKDTKKIRGQGQGQGQPFRGQTLSRPRTGMLEAKAKDQGHKAQVLSKKKKKRSSQKFFRRSPKKKKKKSLHKNFSSGLH